MSDKPFTTVEEQVRILTRRGLICDDFTDDELLRDGYYAIVNGYKAPFLDKAAGAAAGEDRYVEGARFEDLYGLFSFDRNLRSATFRYLNMVETLMRSLMSYSFCEVHKPTEAYLKPTCYTPQAHYMRDESRYEADLNWMINTLEYHARGVEEDSPDGGDGADVRVAHYRDNHGGVPLWVLMCELTFGNLKYFYALMRREEQQAVCRRVGRICRGSEDAAPTPRELLDDLELMVNARNVCAHGERLYNAKMGNDRRGACDLMKTMVGYLVDTDRANYLSMVKHIVEESSGAGELLANVICASGIGETVDALR